MDHDEMDSAAVSRPISSPAEVMEEPLFPSKLQTMLDDAETHSFTEIVSWGTDEISFIVHRKRDFESQVLPKYFKMTKYK